MKKLFIAMTLLASTAYAQPSPETAAPSPERTAPAPDPDRAAAPLPDTVAPEKVGPSPEKVGPPPEKTVPIEGAPPGPEPVAQPPTPESQEKARLGHEVAGEPGEHVEEDPDPTRHFNFANFSYRGKDEYGGPFGDGVQIDPDGRRLEEEPMSAPFILMLVNFGILLIILGKYGSPVARKLAKDRHDQIKSALDEAASLRQQAANKLAEYEKRIKDVDLEIKQLVEGIRTDAEADKVRILKNAEAQAAQLKREAELRIAAEIELARAQLKKEVTAAASSATEKLLREKVTPDDQTRLVSTFISGVESSARKETR
jgi:F-type H+-transporting ATPase subunit b